jgi:putative transposase
MYEWRKMTPDQRAEVLAERKKRRLPWHSPPHWEYAGPVTFLVTATCYDHAPIIGTTPERMAECETSLLTACAEAQATLYAWCILPNHYHILLQTEDMAQVRKALGLFHGRSSFSWNGQDASRGRKVWNNCFDRAMKSKRHFWASLNYVHHNPVRHEYVTRWQDWPFSSADQYLEQVGREQAAEIWKRYPIFDYGKDWDE